MGAIGRFEEIEAWKEARELTRLIYAVTGEGPFSKDYGLRDQIQRAATSVMANIAEGFDGGSAHEFQRFLHYALRSTTEVQSHLYVALDQRYIGQQQFESLYEQSVKIKSLISGFLRYLRASSRIPNLAP